MNDHYRRHKDKTQLDSEWRVPIGIGRYYIHVYVWKNIAALWDNVDPAGDPEWDPSYPACCLCFQRESGNKQAELHLVTGRFGVGVVVHELTHYLFHWLYEFEVGDNEGDDEKACLAMGEWNSKFWNKFYKHYEEAK